MWISLSQRCQLTPLLQRCQCHRCHSDVSCHRCHTSVHSSVMYSIVIVIIVALLSVYITDTLLLPSLPQYYLGHWCHTRVKYTAVTILSLPPMSHLWHIVTTVILVWTAVWQQCKPQPLCHSCVIPPVYNKVSQGCAVLTSMTIVAINLFSLNIFFICFTGPIRKHVL